MTLLRVESLPDGALDAAAAFHADILPDVRAQLASGMSNLVLVFAPAAKSHRGWRLAVIQDLAREYAPGSRINALESDDEAAITAAAKYCESAPGLTGQYLTLAGLSAGGLLSVDNE